MNMLTLILNIGIPVIMIFIGILYKRNSNERIGKTMDLIMPVAMFFNGFSDDEGVALSKDANASASVNRKCSLIWSTSGACTLLLAIVLLALNKSAVHSMSVTLLELECLILVAVFINIEYVLKRNFNKKNNEQSGCI